MSSPGDSSAGLETTAEPGGMEELEPGRPRHDAEGGGLARRFGRWLLNSYLYGRPWVVTLLSFVVALVVGAIFIALADNATRNRLGYFFQHPTDAFSTAWTAISAGYSALFRGSIFNFNSLYSNGGVGVFEPISGTLVNAAPLILGGLAVTVAFRAGLFNIGVQGQSIMGAIGAGYVGFAWHLPIVIHVVVAVLVGIVGGALWGGLVGLLKAKTGAHEVITTIMLNYVAFGILTYLLATDGFKAPRTLEATSPFIDASARLPHLFDQLHFAIIIALIAAVLVWWLLTRSTLGFSIRAIGANPIAARTAGMKVQRGYFTVMVIAGGLAGLVGVSQVLGTRLVVTQDVDGGFGFDAITVALLGRGTPLGTVLAGLLFGAFRAGGVVMSSQTSTPSDIVSIMEPVMVLFIAAPALVRGLFRLRASRSGDTAAQLAKGWNG
jgi:general nucleoside transport system permease protein